MRKGSSPRQKRRTVFPMQRERSSFRKFFAGLFLLLIFSGSSAAELAVPELSGAPEVDGAIDASEWRNATRVNLFNEVARRRITNAGTEMRIGHYGGKLYLALSCRQSEFAPGGSGGKAKRDSAVWWEDSADLLILSRGALFHFITGISGTVYDARNGDSSWNGKWESAVRRNNDSWTLELCVDFQGNGISSEDFRFNVSRTLCRKDMSQTHFSLADSSKINDAEAFFRGSFVRNMPGVTFLVPDGAMQTGALTLCNPYDERMTFQLNGHILHSGKKIRTIVYPVPLDPMKSAPLRLEIPETPGIYQLPFQIAARGTNLLHGEFKFERIGSMRLELRKYFLYGRIEAFLYEQNPALCSLVLELSGNGKVHRKIILTQESKMMPEHDVRETLNPGRKRWSAVFDLAGVPNGRLLMKATGTTADGRSLHAEQAFEYPVRPAWADFNASSNGVLPPPWTAPAVADGSVTCWNRVYRFGKRFLPEGILSAGGELLRGPVVLEAVVNGKICWLGDASGTAIAQFPDAVEISGMETYPEFTLAFKSRLEFDGMLWCDVSFIPRNASRKITLEELRLRVPFTAENSPWLSAPPDDFQRGIGRTWPHWSGCRTGVIPAKGCSGPFVPWFWVGGEFRGLQWFVESRRNWKNEKSSGVLAVTPVQGGGRDFVVTMVDSALTLSGTTEYSFGLQASPVKDKGKRRRTMFCFWEPHGNANRTGYYGEVNYTPFLLSSGKDASLFFLFRFDCDPYAVPVHREDSWHSLRKLFEFQWEDGTILHCFWVPEKKSFQISAGKDARKMTPVMEVRPAWDLKGEKHLLGLAWNKEKMEFWLDAHKLQEKPFPAALHPPTGKKARLRLGGHGGGLCFSGVAAASRKLYMGKFPDDSGDGITFLDCFRDTAGRVLRPRLPAKGVAGSVEYPAEIRNGELFLLARPLYEKIFRDLKKQGTEYIYTMDNFSDLFGVPYSTHPEEFRRMIRLAHQCGLKVAVYLGMQISELSPEWKNYGDDFMLEPFNRKESFYRQKPPQWAYFVTWGGSSWRKFILCNLSRLITEFDLDGIYLDSVCIPHPDINPVSSSRYLAPDGKYQAVWAIRSYRETLKQLRIVTNRLKPGFMIDVHNSNSPLLPVLGLADQVWTGEQYYALREYYYRQPDFQECLPRETVMVEFDGSKFGYHTDMLSYRPSVDGPMCQTASLVNGVPLRRGDHRVWKALESVGFDTASPFWHPYWRNADRIRVEPARNMPVSFFDNGESILLIIANQERQTRKVSVTFRNPPAGKILSDVYEKEKPVPFTGNVCVELKPWSHAVLMIH